MSWWKSNKILRRIANQISSGISPVKKVSRFNWYRKYVLAAGFTAWVDNNIAIKNKKGNGPALVIGNSYPIKDQLSAMGFRWDIVGRSGWFMDVATLKGNQRAVDRLQSLGVPLDSIGLSGVSQQQPQPQRQPQVPQQSQQSQQNILSSWTLATSNKDGSPVALYPSLGNQNSATWEWQDRLGNKGQIREQDIRSRFTSVIGNDNRKVQAPDPLQLFKIFDQMNLEKNTDIESVNTEVNSAEYKDRPSPESIRMKPEHVTVYNAAIRDKFLKTGENVMINALAGTGKTSQLKDLASFKPENERWLYLVFNKKNQVESEKAFPPGVDVMTTHSFLGQVLSMSDESVGGNMKLQESRPGQRPPPKKIGVISKALIPPTWPEPRALNKSGTKCIFNWNAARKTMKIAELAKQFGINPNNSDAMDQLLDIVGKYQIDMDVSTLNQAAPRDYTQDILQKCLEILRGCMPGQLPRGVDRRWSGLRDHDDTLWLPTIFSQQINWGAKKLGYDVVLMDEVQDFNLCQLNMAENLKNKGSRMVGVGDPNQALYYFRGADKDAFNKLVNILTDGKSEPMQLPINWRSDEAILDYTKERTGIEVEIAPHKRGKGMINTVTQSEDYMNNMINSYKANGNMLDKSTAIISPTNAPLVGVALNLLKNNVEFEIVGRDLFNNIERVIKEAVFKPEAIDVNDIRWKIGDYADKVRARWGRDLSKQDEVKETEEYSEAIISILDFLDQNEFVDTSNPGAGPMRTCSDFLLYLKSKIGGVNVDNGKEAAAMSSRLNDEKESRKKVQLTTSHRSKGFEYDAVAVLGDDKFNPNREDMPDWERSQLKNAQYVTYTRAKNELWVLLNKE